MPCPNMRDREALRLLARYLVGKPRVNIWFGHPADPGHLTVFTDSGRAGRPYSRRSTSGRALLYGAHLLKSVSTTKAGVALTCPEAEL